MTTTELVGSARVRLSSDLVEATTTRWATKGPELTVSSACRSCQLTDGSDGSKMIASPPTLSTSASSGLILTRALAAHLCLVLLFDGRQKMLPPPPFQS